MIDSALVLNCPSTMGAYQHRHIENIECWLDFFVNEERIHVVATPSSERWQDLAHLEYDKELYTLLPVLSFDTCSRWQAGLFEALALYQPRNHVFLWAADFFYSDEAKRAAEKMLDYDGDEDLVVGTIEAGGKKEDIDRCATHPFIEIWFPEEFEIIQSKGFSKPRSELLRFSVPFLEYSLRKRWFPTEQTIHLIFQCLWNDGDFEVEPILLPKIEDDGEARNQPNVIQQVERMEVWLKYMWRERQCELDCSWWEMDEYKNKCIQSFETAMRAYDILVEDCATAA